VPEPRRRHRRDSLVSLTEGAPSYGPILASFTTRGDTSPASGALDRFPVANGEGELRYSRRFRVSPEVAGDLGNFTAVQHGVDLNDNGVYDNVFKVSMPATYGKIVAE
jgi:hypothetical protein